MVAYLIVSIDVHDAAGFEEYRSRVTPVVEAYGGSHLVRTTAVEMLEGVQPRGGLVLLEFPSIDAARSFYHSPDYAPLLRQRLASATADIMLVEGG